MGRSAGNAAQCAPVQRSPPPQVPHSRSCAYLRRAARERARPAAPAARKPPCPLPVPESCPRRWASRCALTTQAQARAVVRVFADRIVAAASLLAHVEEAQARKVVVGQQLFLHEL